MNIISQESFDIEAALEKCHPGTAWQRDLIREQLTAAIAAERDECQKLRETIDEQASLIEEMGGALREAVDLAWVEDSHAVCFDNTVLFGPHYDFEGLDGFRRQEFLAQYECVVWPGRKWSAYCTYEGSLWFERFDSAEEAKEACMRLLDQVLPEHPTMKAHAALDKWKESK